MKPSTVSRSIGRTSRANTTIRDVANHAGVSPATVSRVLNGGYPVAEIKRTQVERAVRELGYIRNAYAQALRRTSSGVVGVIIHDVADPFFAQIAAGIQEVAAGPRRPGGPEGGGSARARRHIGRRLRRRADGPRRRPGPHNGQRAHAGDWSVLNAHRSRGHRPRAAAADAARLPGEGAVGRPTRVGL